MRCTNERVSATGMRRSVTGVCRLPHSPPLVSCCFLIGYGLTVSKTCLQGPPSTSTFDWCFRHPWQPRLYSCTACAIMSHSWPTSCDTSCISHRLISAHVHSTLERESRRLLCHYLFRLHLSHTSPKPSSLPASDLNSSLPPLSKLLYLSSCFRRFLALSCLLHLIGFLQCWTCNESTRVS